VKKLPRLLEAVLKLFVKRRNSSPTPSLGKRRGLIQTDFWQTIHSEKFPLFLRACMNINNPQFQLWEMDTKTKPMTTVSTVFLYFHTTPLEHRKNSKVKWVLVYHTEQHYKLNYATVTLINHVCSANKKTFELKKI
jgi:hypothetical protein